MAGAAGFDSARTGRALRFPRRPIAPMRRAHVQPLARLRVDPAAADAPTGKHQRMWAVAVDNGQLEVAIEGRAGDFLPHSCDLPAPRRAPH